MGLLLALMGGCNMGGVQPTYTSTDFNDTWNALNASLSAIQADAIQDPAVSAAYQGLEGVMSSVGVASLAPAGMAKATALLFNPASLIPLEVKELPRGGYDYTDPSDPYQYTPESPYDFEVKWTTEDGQIAVFGIDWDDGEPTVFVQTASGDQVERPQQSFGTLHLNGELVARGDLYARWVQCASTGGTYIDEPRTFSFLFNVQGKKAQVQTDVSFDHTQEDKIQLRYGLSYETLRGSASIGFDITANGTTTRDANCYTTGFDANSVTFGATLDVNDHNTREQHSAEFSVTFSNAVLDGNGNLQRADVDGYVKLDGTPAVTFNGTLDDLDQTCPGAHVNLYFADRTMTLQEWMIQNGYCTP